MVEKNNPQCNDSIHIPLANVNVKIILTNCFLLKISYVNLEHFPHNITVTLSIINVGLLDSIMLTNGYHSNLIWHLKTYTINKNFNKILMTYNFSQLKETTLTILM